MALNIIRLANIDYYLSTELFDYNKTLFRACKGRDVIKKLKLTPNDYIFGYITKSGWKESTEDYSKAKVLIKVEWYNSKINPNNTQLTNTQQTNIQPNNTQLTNIELIPDILELENEEKFKDSNGRVLNILIRGERNYTRPQGLSPRTSIKSSSLEKCFFRVKDVSKEFEMPRLQDVLLDKEKKYFENKHYKIFFTSSSNMIGPTNSGTDQSKNKEVYLTYLGILKILFSSRSGNAEAFQEWWAETLFTVQMGTEESKYNLIKSMFNGASIGAIKEAFKTSSGKTPCVYLFVIGNANSLLKTNTYTADTLLYKFA